MMTLLNLGNQRQHVSHRRLAYGEDHFHSRPHLGEGQGRGFFPQTDFHVPEKEMREHTDQHMTIPAGVLTHFIMIHAELGFGLLKTLFDRPPHAAQPHKRQQASAQRGIAEIVPIGGLCSHGAFEHQPHRGRISAVGPVL